MKFANLLMDEDFEEIGRQLAAQDEDEESQIIDQEDEPQDRKTRVAKAVEQDPFLRYGVGI